MDDSRARDYPLADHDAHARSVAANAYWEQIRRTVNGKPVSDTQIAMIVDAVTARLALQPTDVVLDLACGNGALSSYLFGRCAGLVGVDASSYLIEVATRDFARPPAFRFEFGDVASYVLGETDPRAFTKVLIYGAFQYFAQKDCRLLFTTLNSRFPAVSKIFVGNIPDRRHVARFYRDRAPTEVELEDHESRIGVWYVPDDLAAVAEAEGWSAECSHMPEEFYGSAYRFDLLLERRAR